MAIFSFADLPHPCDLVQAAKVELDEEMRAEIVEARMKESQKVGLLPWRVLPGPLAVA